ncbi:hypothetical protein [Methanobrevibacter woesei]|nr:hypothetical protein [Methanobrevibacter woesei]
MELVLAVSSTSLYEMKMIIKKKIKKKIDIIGRDIDWLIRSKLICVL